MGSRLLFSAVIGAGILCAGGAFASTTFIVSYEAEAAGVENTTATFSVGGVETFNELPVGTYPQSIATTFGTSGAGSTIDGTYTAGSAAGIQINQADQYGGAGGTGNYIVAFPNTPYTLSLTSDVQGGVNYFGYWLSALDPGNLSVSMAKTVSCCSPSTRKTRSTQSTSRPIRACITETQIPTLSVRTRGNHSFS